MSLRLKLILAFATVFGIGFAGFGYAALSITSGAVEREVERRIDATLTAIGRHPGFFITEAEPNREQFAQVAAISGFEIVVPQANGRDVRGSSLAPESAEGVLRAAGNADRFDHRLGGQTYRVVRARSGGKTFYLLSPLGAAARVKEDIRSSLVLVAGIGLLAGIILGVIAAGTITGPLRRLADRALKVREGRLDVEVPTGGGREVRALSDSFREMLSGLSRYREERIQREKMATLGRFSASVAHELRNPLSSMQMTLQMLRSRLDGEPAEDVDLVLAEISRLDHSIEELLFYSGTPRYVFEESDLCPLTREAVGVLRPLADHLDVGVRVECEGGLLVRLDERKIRQAVMNLVLNAIAASPAGEEVLLTARGDGEAAQVRVEDSGPGVPAEIEKTMREPFVSGREGGTGLGLAVVAAVAEAHGGTVHYGRRDGRTEFTLTLRSGRMAHAANPGD